MAAAVTPGALPAPKKNTRYRVVLTATGFGTASVNSVTWTVSSGSLPAGFTLSKVTDYGSGAGGVASIAVVDGPTPNALNPGTFTATITASDGTNSATCVSTGVTLVVDGPDNQGYHGSEANRSTITTYDTIDHGPGLPIADALLRAWPSNPPSQNA